jgi:hypothetical protein
VPRQIKTSLAVLATVFAGTAVATPAAGAATTKQLIRQVKQALRASPGAPTDLTPILKQLSVRLPGLEGSQRRQAHSLLARPTDGSTDPQDNGYDVPEAPASPYCTAHFCVHWVASGADAPSLADGDSDGIPDYVETADEAAEQSHLVENEQLGWREPKGDGALGGGSDKTDIYLKQLGGTGIYGYTAPDPGQQLNDIDHSQFAYLVIDNDFRASEFVNYTSPIQPLEVTLAHEYNHVLQFAIDTLQDTWMFESTAVWMEGKVFPEILDYLQYLRGWVQLTNLPLTTFNSADANDPNNVKVYGTAVWNKWLDTQFGPDVIRQAWESSLTTPRKSMAVQAYDKAIRQQSGGGDFASRFDLFATKTAEWQSTDSGFPEGRMYPDVVRAGSARTNGPGGRIKLNHTTYGLVDVRPEAFQRIRLGATAPAGTNAAIALVGRVGGLPGGHTVLKLKALPNGGPGTVTLENPGNFSRITMVLVNADFKVSGGSPLTGEWNYTRDAQRFYARVSTDLRPPRVVRVSPRAKARQVALFPRVKVTFSEPVRGVSSKTIQLVGKGGHVVAADVRAASGGRVAILTPHRSLSAASSFRVRVLKTVTDTTVNPLAKTFVSSFTTKR